MIISKTFIPLYKGVDFTSRKIPLITVKSNQNGPVVWIAAAIHGDEVTGIAIIHTILSKLQNYPLKQGTLYFFPIMNPGGFEMITRREPFDEADLNRQFPGDPHGTTAQRHAAAISHTILKTKPDYVIDLHTDSNNSIAYTIVDDVSQSRQANLSALALAQTLGLPWAFDRPYPDYDPKTSLSGYLMTQNIPTVTIELGGPMVVNEFFRRKGLESVWKFLQSLNMVPSRQSITLQTDIPKTAFYFEERIQCDHTGIVDYRIKPGQEFSKGQILGKIRNVYGKEVALIKAPKNGLLFSHEDQSIAMPGQDLFTYVCQRPLQFPSS